MSKLLAPLSAIILKQSRQTTPLRGEAGNILGTRDSMLGMNARARCLDRCNMRRLHGNSLQNLILVFLASPKLIVSPSTPIGRQER